VTTKHVFATNYGQLSVVLGCNTLRSVRKSFNNKGGIMRLIARFADIISLINHWVGQVFSLLSLAIVGVCFTVVVQRYAFATSYIWMQDLYVWLNGAMFMTVAGFALLRDDHVRVDIYYRPASMRRKALIDLIGVLFFLLPFTAVVY